MKKFILLTFLFCLLLQIKAVAKISMPVTFGNGMVLQREMPVRIFGEASEGATLTVRFNGQEKIAVSEDGRWKLALQPMSAGGPFELHISGDNDEIIYSDVMIGEVWLAGGQSNMAMALQSTNEYEKYLPAEENSSLRFLKIPVTEFGEINREGLKWEYFDKESVKKFSAVAYFFTTELQKRLGVTVGIIGSKIQR